MKARERIIRRYLAGSEKFEAVVAIETAALAPQIGYWASRQLAVKLGCPVALWRLAYLCEMGKPSKLEQQLAVAARLETFRPQALR